MTPKEQIQKLKTAKNLILKVRDNFKGFGEYDSYNTIAQNIQEHIEILEAEI